MTERENLIREIVADPENDTVRLGFADWLEEQGDPTTADRAWAQCIKLDHELRHGRSNLMQAEGERMVKILCFKYGGAWLGEAMKCPKCKGLGSYEEKVDPPGVTMFLSCSHCWRTGNLLSRREGYVSYGSATSPREVAWRLGFPSAVTCDPHEVWTVGAGRQYVPAPWARAVVAALPVVEFVIAGRFPELYKGRPGAHYVWEGAPPGEEFARTDRLPFPIIDGMNPPADALLCATRPTLGEALTACWRSAASWAKNWKPDNHLSKE